MIKGGQHEHKQSLQWWLHQAILSFFTTKKEFYSCVNSHNYKPAVQEKLIVEARSKNSLGALELKIFFDVAARLDKRCSVRFAYSYKRLLFSGG